MAVSKINVRKRFWIFCHSKWKSEFKKLWSAKFCLLICFFSLWVIRVWDIKMNKTKIGRWSPLMHSFSIYLCFLDLLIIIMIKIIIIIIIFIIVIIDINYSLILGILCCYCSIFILYDNVSTFSIIWIVLFISVLYLVAKCRFIMTKSNN